MVLNNIKNKCVTNHVLLRNKTYYFLKRFPYDLKDYYSVKSKCLFMRPIFFVYKDELLDTFHGKYQF